MKYRMYFILLLSRKIETESNWENERVRGGKRELGRGRRREKSGSVCEIVHLTSFHFWMITLKNLFYSYFVFPRWLFKDIKISQCINWWPKSINLYRYHLSILKEIFVSLYITVQKLPKCEWCFL